MSKSKYSESGQEIYRHEERTTPFQLATGDEATIDLITAHIEKHIGVVDFIFHEIISDTVHIDVLRVPPTKERNYYTLVTCGMSTLPMTVPPGAEKFRFAELLICLPADWPMTEETYSLPENYWPIEWLKTLARLPHEYNSWLYAGHTIPNGDPEKPFAGNTLLSGVMLTLPSLAEDASAFFNLRASDEKEVHFFCVVPLYSEEMEFKLKKGAEALLEKHDEEGITVLLDIGRKNVCKKSIFGFFKK
ncbi:hypothetical protein L3i20_v229460 [Paenibacillus sp. L3-i20]|nr:hypothetical protein L3i20_v229460 [Paenibacillus sp. L3-i20]